MCYLCYGRTGCRSGYADDEGRSPARVVSGRGGEAMTNPHTSGGWKKGQSGNPKGRTPKAIEVTRKRKEMANLYAPITIENCTPDQWKKIVQKAVEDAEHGDRYARDW